MSCFQALRRLLDTCLSYSRDGRSSFRNVNICLWNVFFHLKLWMIFDTSLILTQVLVSLENLMSSLPKIHKSLSGALSIKWFSLLWLIVFAQSRSWTDRICKTRTCWAPRAPRRRPRWMPTCPAPMSEAERTGVARQRRRLPHPIMEGRARPPVRNA